LLAKLEKIVMSVKSSFVLIVALVAINGFETYLASVDGMTFDVKSIPKTIQGTLEFSSLKAYTVSSK